MYVIRIDKKVIYFSLCILFCISAFILLNKPANEKMTASAFLEASEPLEEEFRQIEVFDISAGEVIARYNQSNLFRKEAAKYLGSITGMYGNINAFPSRGYIVKIPLNPPVSVTCKWLDAAEITSVDEVYVIFPEQNDPYLLILDEKSRPLCYDFTSDASRLRKLFIDHVKVFKPEKPPEHSMEELYHDVMMIMLAPYIDQAVDDYYEINTGYSPSVAPWQSKILSIERPNGYRTFMFTVELEVMPYLGAHNSIGVDRVKICASSGEIRVLEYKHIKSYPIPPWLKN